MTNSFDVDCTGQKKNGTTHRDMERYSRENVGDMEDTQEDGEEPTASCVLAADRHKIEMFYTDTCLYYDVCVYIHNDTFAPCVNSNQK